ncbi:homeodomain-interacting protein kinase 2-like [Hippocampus comes]|uniref:homeodomain-interacting protein kinase 2-like n=1 Tax=Hippocampus comes TaxID=109280 RepID=UPI00094F2531|nr:PREDICTED: homeodomain-interacting protein kinase 2-like [Hippocampus comes]
MDSYGIFGDRLVPGARLYSASTSYKVLSLLSSGTFGKVAKCRKMDSDKTVAVKMIRNQGSFAEQAKIEIDTLQKVKMLQNSKRHLVLWKRVFSDMGHICLEFEYLDKSLYDLMRERQFKHLQVKEIRPMLHQLASALDHLKRAHMIHADIRLDNVMLINHQRQPYRIKISDLCLAQGASATKHNSNVQSHTYWSPEILLGAPYTEATDMWSVGCVAAFLYIGTHMYPGKKEYETIKYIMETQGPFPEDILVSGEKTGDFFHRDNKTSSWRLKTPEYYQQETGFAARDTRKIKLTSLNHLQQLQPWVSDAQYPADKDVHADDKQMFVDVLKGMLHLNASQRLTPRQVLAHPFVTMSHLKLHRDVSQHAKSCYELMSHCKKETSRMSKRKSSTLQRSSSKSSQKKKTSTTRIHKKSHDATCHHPAKRQKSGDEDDRTNQAKQPAAERSLTRLSIHSRLKSKDAKYIKLKTRFAARFMEEQSAMDENQTFQRAPTPNHQQQHHYCSEPGTKAWALGKDLPKGVLLRKK